jgi:hypothetical protein
VSRVAISIQTLDGRKDVYLRKEVGTMHKGTILAAVEAMLDDRPAHTIGFAAKPTFKGHKPKKLAAYKPDEETLPGVEVDATVEHALAT